MSTISRIQQYLATAITKSISALFPSPFGRLSITIVCIKYQSTANVNESRKALRDKTFRALRVNGSSSAVIVSGENFRKISGYSSKADYLFVDNLPAIFRCKDNMIFASILTM